ncbi:serine hydrolase domain-containing protein [Lactiplantibacillus mudanjiangensis]|nr:serine hydrolase domain-containing protein [Lactiplantibacillus mudanjiangensis]
MPILTVLAMGCFIIWIIFAAGHYRVAQQIEISKVQANDKKYRTAKDYNENVRKNSDFSREISKILNSKNFRGTAYVVENNQVVLNKSYNLKRDNMAYPNRSLDQFLTSVTIMQYVTRGRISLDTKISRFFPKLTNSKKVAIKDLINMTSGINNAPITEVSGLSDSEIIQKTVDQTVIRKKEIGKQEDSAVNYVLLAGIIEKLSGKEFSTVMKQNYFKPYRLNHSFLMSSAKSTKQPVIGHTGEKQAELKLSASMVAPLIGYNRYAYTAGDMYFMMKSIVQGSIVSRSQVYALLNNESDDAYSAGFSTLISGAWLSNIAALGTHTLMIISESGNQSVILQTNTDTTKYNMYNLGKKIYIKLNKNLNTFPNYAKYQ